ncbi:MAG: TolC family protein [Gemmatimonadaceae bacterium]
MRRSLAVVLFVLTAARAAAQAGPALIDLPSALRLADAQNLDVQLAREALHQAEAARTGATELFIPSVSPGVGYHRRDGLAQASPSGVISGANYSSYSPGAAFGAQIAVGDAIFNSLVARRLVTASGEGLSAQRQVSTVRAAQQYFDLAKAKSLVDVVRAAIATSQDYQNQIHEAVALGIAFRGDELRVESQTDHYQVVLRDAIAQQRVAAVELAKTLHLDANVELVPRDSDLVPLVLVDTASASDSLVARALRGRPEVRQAAAVVSASEASRSAARYGALVPAVGAQVFTGALGGGPDSGRTRVGAMTDYAVGLSWRIGPGGLFDLARIDASEAQLASARLNDAKERDIVAAEVVSGLARVRALGEQIALSARALETATETLRLTRARREFGVGIVLEDIQAQQAVTQARGDYVTAIAEFDKAQYALSKSVGAVTQR